MIPTRSHRYAGPSVRLAGLPCTFVLAYILHFVLWLIPLQNNILSMALAAVVIGMILFFIASILEQLAQRNKKREDLKRWVEERQGDAQGLQTFTSVH